MANRADFEMLNNALGNLGNSFVINRQMAQQSKERDLARGEAEKDRELRERKLNEQIAGRKDAADARNQPLFRWKSRGADITAHSLAEFGALSQQHPADPEEDGLPLIMSGMDDTGTQKQLRITIPKDLAKTPENQQKIRDQIKQFSDLIGAKPRPATGTSSTAAAAPGSVIYDKATGKVITTVPSAAGEEYETTREEFPGTEATTIPGKKGETHWFKPDEPDVPERVIPATPSRVVTTRKKIGGKAARGDAHPSEAPPDEELVSVINPQGKPVRIRKSQLEQALASGYTER